MKMYSTMRTQRKNPAPVSDEDRITSAWTLDDLDTMHRKRTLSVVSMKSTGSEIPEVDETDELEIEIREKKCCRKPFIFKILQLNAPEKFWIILGCITSITFGTITPVSLSSFPQHLSE